MSCKVTATDVLLQSDINMSGGLKIFTSVCAAIRVPMQERGEMHPAVSEVQPQVKTVTNPTKATLHTPLTSKSRKKKFPQKMMKLCRAECSDGSDEEDCSK